MVKLSTYVEKGPALLTYHGKGNHVLMPMFVQWDTPSPYSPEPVAVSDTVAAQVQEVVAAQEGPASDMAPPEAVSEAPSAPADIQEDTPADTPKPKRGRKAKAAA